MEAPGNDLVSDDDDDDVLRGKEGARGGFSYHPHSSWTRTQSASV